MLKTWATRIADAKKRGHFTPRDVYYATDSWLTCAVGEKHGWDWGERTESEDRLGWEFSAAVRDGDIDRAESFYHAILALPTPKVRR